MSKEIETLGFLLARASFIMANRLRKNLKKSGIDLPHSQFVVMRLLYQKEGLSQQEIAEYLNKDGAAIKRSLDNLEGKGLIVRTPISLCKYNIYITEKGKEWMPEVIKIAEQTTTQLLEGVSSNTYQTAISFLKHIYESK